MIAQQQLPGLYFDVQEQPAPDALPRMDIAGFVGFADRGPLHLPVAVEDIGEFRDLFGTPERLGWDTQARRWQFSHLHASVEAFFLNGGVRCWVVRVADAQTIIHERALPVPGLFDEQGAPALCEARSPGGWARELQPATRLRRVRMIPQGAPELHGERLVLQVLASVIPLVVGDLLELDYTVDGVLAYLAVDDIVQPQTGTLRLAGRVLPFAADQFGALPQALTTVAVAAVLTGSQPSATHRLTFDLLSYRGELLVHRIEELGFTAAHPRFWGMLPTDEILFQFADGAAQPPQPAAQKLLWDEATVPRFPFAGPAASAEIYLPLAMQDRLAAPGDPSSAPLSSPTSPPTEVPGEDQAEVARLAEAGLEDYSSALFLDADLARTNVFSLAEAFNDKAYRRAEPVDGLHSLMRVEEVSMIAVPDAVHPGWQQGTPSFQYLPAPDLDAVFDPQASHVSLQWNAIPDALAYRVQVATQADFSDPQDIDARRLTGTEALSTAAHYPLPALCRQVYYFRVRAESADQLSAWSRERVLDVPEAAFAACGEIPVTLDVILSLVAGPALQWQFETPFVMFSPAAEFELQQAEDPQFLTARSSWLTTSGVAVAANATLQYFRVRVVPDATPGPWSNTVVVTPSLNGGWLMQAEAEYSTDTLHGVHEQLLHVCAARADAVAILSLPQHLRVDASVAYLDLLLASRDNHTPSYAALFHSWPLSREIQDAQTVITSHPPDGYAAAVMATRAIQRGAWHAPANVPLRGVLGLAHTYTPGPRARLTGLGINVLLADARGFLWQSANTLSRSTELCLINVRRLLIVLRRLALREGRRFVFEPNSADFRGQVRAQFETLLNRMYTRGAFRGRSAPEAYRVNVAAPPNTEQSLELGRFIVELAVAPSAPLQFLRVRLVQSAPEELTIEEQS